MFHCVGYIGNLSRSTNKTTRYKLLGLLEKINSMGNRFPHASFFFFFFNKFFFLTPISEYYNKKLNIMNLVTFTIRLFVFGRGILTYSEYSTILTLI